MINVEVKEHLIDVKLRGKIYVEEASRIRNRLQEYINQGFATYRIDFSEVDYIDSSGLGAMIAMHKKGMQLGGEGVIIMGMRGAVKELFELTRLIQVFRVEQ